MMYGKAPVWLTEVVQEWAPIWLGLIIFCSTFVIISYGIDRRLNEEIALNIPKEDWDFIMTPPVSGPVCNSDYENYYLPAHFSCGFIMRKRLDSEILGEGTFR